MRFKSSIVSLAILLCAASPAYALRDLIIINSNNNPLVDLSTRLVSSAPYDNEVLDKAPTAVTLNFSQAVRPDKSAIRVYDAYGMQVNDSVVTANGTAISVALPALASGRYSIKWRARCMCDDDTELSDNFHFTVK